MKKNNSISNIIVLISLSILLSSSPTSFSASAEENIFISKSNIKGGIIVHAGCGDGTLVAEMGNNKQFVIQGLQNNLLMVEKARRTIRNTPNEGRVSIKHWRGIKLPYAENMVNLLIIDDDNTTVPANEINRVLAPRGKAIIHKDCQVRGLDLQPFSAGYYLVRSL